MIILVAVEEQLHFLYCGNQALEAALFLGYCYFFSGGKKMEKPCGNGKAWKWQPLLQFTFHYINKSCGQSLNECGKNDFVWSKSLLTERTGLGKRAIDTLTIVISHITFL